MIHASGAPFLCDGDPVSAERFQSMALDPARCVVVEACAGSGKTWLLSARIVRALLAGASPDEILAITFTRKAADEMAARVNEWLVRMAQGTLEQTERVLGELSLDPAAAKAHTVKAQALVHQVLGHPHPMTIDTFHGWFAKLRSLAPLMQSVNALAALAPVPAVVVDQAFDVFLARVGSDKSLLADYTALVRYVGWEAANAALRDAFIHQRVEWLSFTENAQLPAAYASAAFEKLHPEFDAVEHVEAIRATLGDLANSLQSQVLYKKRYEKLVEVLEDPARFDRKRIQQMLDALTDADSGAAFVFSKGKELLKEANERFGDLAAFQRAVESCQGVLQRCVQALIDREIVALHARFFRLGSTLSDCYAQEKRARSVLDYSDLELDAARLLESRDTAAQIEAKLDARIKHILVDEFQDTNPLQWRVLSDWLSGYAGAGRRPSIFVVGDPKQSIYRFRRADSRIFESASALLREQFAAVVLTTQRTRRNAPVINELINAVFTGTPAPFARQFTLSPQAGRVLVLPLAMKTVAPVSTPSLNMRDSLRQPRVEVQDDRATQEAAGIVRVLLQLAATHGEAWRWHEVMVLVNRWASAQAMEDAFRVAGVPFMTGRNGGLLDAPEVQDVLALLKVLSQPQDSLALAQVLKSPLFGWDDGQLLNLLALTAAKGWWHALAHCDAPEAMHAFACLSSWRALAAELPIHDALDAIYAQADVIGKFTAIVPPERARPAAANLERILELALDSEGGRYPSLARFVDELLRYERLSENDAPSQGISSADERVLITTVHGAKGLERDVVVLADANQVDSNPKPHTLVDWPPLAARPAHFSHVFSQNLRTSAQQSVQNAAKTQEELDMQARLYVALTRARRILVVSGQDKRGISAQSWYARVAACEEHIERLDSFTASLEVHARIEAVQWVEDFRASATGASPVVEAPEDEVQRLGQCWHAWLERLTQYPKTPVQDDEIRAQASRYRLSMEKVRELFSSARGLIENPACAVFFGAKDAFSEAGVVSANGEVMRLDRVARINETIWIGDYKLSFDASRALDYAAQLRKYREQMQEIERSAPVRAVLIAANGQLFELNPPGDGFMPLAAIH
jgi:ATP-dependent helicase/nuclease subunit A